MTVQPCSASVCQLRIDFLDLTLAPPSGDGICNTDVLTVTGGASQVPPICGTNAGQHVYVDFDGTLPIQIAVAATPSYTLGRHWNIKVSQINCVSENRGENLKCFFLRWIFFRLINILSLAPPGCLQYHRATSRVISSLNYGSTGNSQTNSVGVEGSRQLANTNYGICVAKAPNQCSITWSQVSSDPYSFTVTGDVGAVDPALLGTAALQQQTCTTDFVVIPDPVQNGMVLGSDRFCGLGLAPTTSKKKTGWFVEGLVFSNLFLFSLYKNA